MRRAVALVLVATATVGCGAGVGATTIPSPLPPHTTAELAAIFDPLVAPLGYQVTRAALIDPGTYEPRSDGTHLAVYLAPIAPIDEDAYATGVLTTARVFLPMVFDRWAALASFDVCQEPFAWPPDSTPPSQTIVNVTRDGATQAAWSEVDLAGLVAAARGNDGIVVWAAPSVRITTTWQAAGGG